MPELKLPPGVEGLVAAAELPDQAWLDRWERIFLRPGVKDRLLNHALFLLLHRVRLSPVGLPAHGLIVLAGPPGTGKTTLAGGLADQLARATEGGGLIFVTVDPHAFPSQMLGESQRSTARLFERTLPDLARRGRPVVVLLDEVEALAVSRSGASLETNPVDVHRSTDAVLAGLDHVAATCPNLLFVATTNYRAGVDEAFLSRADLVEEIGLPGPEAVSAILRDAVHEVAPGLDLDAASLERLAGACVAAGYDARQVRKLVLRAATSRRELALQPERLTADDLLAAVAGVDAERP
ncbi:MAG TPA: AAA family ATPase [Candidatus Limnocylindrales bacterium]|nr:AAA family ATPase [Candidatus Limnocylindrales bacterium]